MDSSPDRSIKEVKKRKTTPPSNKLQEELGKEETRMEVDHIPSPKEGAVTSDGSDTPPNGGMASSYSPILGKAKIIEDRVLAGNTVMLPKKKDSKKNKMTNQQENTNKDPVKEGAQGIIEQLTRLLESWLKRSIETLGIHAIEQRRQEKGMPDNRHPLLR